MPLPDFPEGDVHAARAWLRDRTLEEFEYLENVSANDTDEWTKLQDIILAAVGMKSGQMMKSVKKIIGDDLSTESTRIPTTADKRKEIGKKVAAAILEKTDVEWKDDLGEWLESAMIVFMPRAIKLWKKSQWKGQTKKDGSSSHDGASQASSLVKGPKRGAPSDGKPSSNVVMTDPSQMKGQEDNKDTHTSKKLRIKTADPKGKMREEYAPAQGITQYQRTPNLDDWEIEVRLDEETFILIAVTTILKDERLNQPSVDIRPEHLDFGKLLTLIQTYCEQWDSSHMILYWGKDSVSIQDEEDFINAVGVMQFGLEKLFRENVLL